MNKTIYHDHKYFDIIRQVLDQGVSKPDRTGTGTVSVPFVHQQFDITGGTLPMLTTKKMFVRGIIYELLWYIHGGRNIQYLNNHDVHIWDNWADQDGDLGPVYGAQWRNWTGVDDNGNIKHVDQLSDVISRLNNNPCDRRILLSSWNVTQLPDMNLPPCHCLVQFWSDGEQLCSHLYQRSADLFLGVPFNIVQYSMFTHMVAHVTGLKPTKFVWTGGDVHLYNNHFEQAMLQISRDPFPSPILQLNQDVQKIDDFGYEDFKIIGYQHHPPIKADVSI